MAPDLPIRVFLFAATLLWCHGTVLLWEWGGQLRRHPGSERVALVVGLLGALVPVVVGFVAVVFVGAVVGLPSVVALLALIVPVGLAIAMRVELAGLTGGTLWRLSGERRRILATLGLVVVVLAIRGLP